MCASSEIRSATPVVSSRRESFSSQSSETNMPLSKDPRIIQLIEKHVSHIQEGLSALSLGPKDISDSCVKPSAPVSEPEIMTSSDGATSVSLPIMCFHDPSWLRREEDLRRDLSFIFEDIDHVDDVLEAYKLTVLRFLEENEQKQFENTVLKENIFFLGSPFFDHTKPFEKFVASQLSPELISNPELIAKKEKFREVYQKFVDLIKLVSTRYRVQVLDPAQEKVQRVTVLFSGACGGGHIAPKDAIEQFLKDKKIEVLSIDIDEEEAPYSRSVVGVSKGEIYSECVAKRGDKKTAQELYTYINKNKPFESRRFVKDIREKIVAFNTDHIFTVAAGISQLAAISFQTGIPMTFVHTDHVFHRDLAGLVLKQNCMPDGPFLVTFTSASENKDFFHIFRPDPGYERPLMPYCIPLGIPVRRQFHVITEEEKRHLRIENGILEDALVCKVAVGYYGMKTVLKTILQKLQRESGQFQKPFHVIVACGVNAELKQELETEFLAKSDSCPNLTFDIRGHMDADQMALSDKLSDFMITKPGGSTTSEAVQMEKKVLFPYLEELYWEAANGKYLMDIGLGFRLNFDSPIGGQINALLQQPIKRDVLPKEPWDVRLDKFLENDRRPMIKK